MMAGLSDWNNTERLCSYLYTLDRDYGLAFQRLNNVSRIPRLDLNDTETFNDCLAILYQLGENSIYWLAKLLSSSAWTSYLLTYTDDAYHGLVKAVRDLKSPENDLLLFRACYRYGTPIIADNFYDSILSLYNHVYPNQVHRLVETSYDDDIYPSVIMSLLSLGGVISRANQTKSQISTEEKQIREKYMADLESSKSTSIRPFINPDEFFNFITASSADVQFSLKIDGVNCKLCFDDNELKVAISRGRGDTATPFDYTDALKVAIPSEITNEDGLNHLAGEGYVDFETLEKLRQKYPDKDFKTPKSVAMSMLRSPHLYDDEDLKGLHFIAYFDEKHGPTADKMYDNLESAGFVTPYHIRINRSDIPINRELFDEWLSTEVLDKMWDYSTKYHIPSDGVVCDLCSVIATERNDQYSDQNVAIKFSHWSAAEYSSIVKNIIIEQRRVTASVVVEIEPVITRDFNTETMVNVGSVAILFEDNIVPGTRISFVRKSEANNVYIRGSAVQ